MKGVEKVSKGKFCCCKTIVVLGMHRSGTSMTAGILTKLGINMGERLLGKKKFNPVGHFEDQDFLELNKRILKSARGSWDCPPDEEAIVEQKKIFEKEIEDLIKQKSKGIWGWKDPRTCLTIDLYFPYLQNPYFIVCHRNPQSVALSLNKRNGMPLEKGIALAKEYEERIKNFFNKNPNLKKLDVNYEEIKQEPEKWVRQIVDFIEIEVSEKDFKKAVRFVLPEEKIRKLSKIAPIISLIEAGLKKPWKIPGYLARKIFNRS